MIKEDAKRELIDLVIELPDKELLIIAVFIAVMRLTNTCITKNAEETDEHGGGKDSDLSFLFTLLK